MDFNAVCRTCLSTSSLKPIFPIRKLHRQFSNSIFLITGVRIKFNDGLPQKICVGCLKEINNTMKFRAKCKDTEKELQNITREAKGVLSIDVYINNIHREHISTTTLENDDSSDEDDDGNDQTQTSKNETFDNDEKPIQYLLKQRNESLRTKTKSNNESKREVDADINETFNNDDTPLKCILKYDDKVQSVKTSKPNTQICVVLQDKLNSDNFIISNTNLVGTYVNTNDNSVNNTIKILSVEENHALCNENEVQNEEAIDGNIETVNQRDGEVLNNNTLKVNIDTEQVSIQDNDDEIENTLDNDKYNTFEDHNIVEEKVIDNTFYDCIQRLYDVDFNDQSGKRVICKLCHKSLSKKSINSHLSNCHPGIDPRKIKCKLCDCYIHSLKMKQHFVRVHANNPLMCRFCKQNFEQENDLVIHVAACCYKQKKHRNAQFEVTECTICHEKLQKSSLKRHHAVKHAGLKPVCEHCGKGFGSLYRLNEHYRAKHGYEKFRCSYCPFQSASAVGIKNHEARHIGEKPYVCVTCGAKFHASYLLRQHMKSHRTERLYKCDACSGCFKTSNALNGHIRYVHRGERRGRK